MGGLLLGVFGALVLAAVPIGFALATAAAIAIVAADLPLVIIPQQIVAGMDSFPMLAVPLFILAGFLMDVGGISRRLVTLARSLVGHLPGGLGQVVIMAEIFFSGVSGSTSADAAAIGGIMVPQLTANGYSRERSTAIVSAACGMGILIPPAIVMVVYGVIGNVSIGALFVASIAPALLIAVGLMTQIGWQARREGWPAEPRASFADIRHAGFDALLPLFMIVVILGGIRFGLFTPTEAAAVAVAYALLLAGPVYRSLSASDLWNKVVQTAMVSGMVLFVVGAARLLGWVLAVMEVPQTLASSVVGMGGGQAGFLILTILVFLPLGAILEGVPAVVLLTPILLPLARQLGIDPVHYGAVIVATQGISVFLPPVGVSLLVACSVGGVEPSKVARPLWPYLALMLALTLVIAFLPGVVLFLPTCSVTEARGRLGTPLFRAAPPCGAGRERVALLAPKRGNGWERRPPAGTAARRAAKPRTAEPEEARGRLGTPTSGRHRRPQGRGRFLAVCLHGAQARGLPRCKRCVSRLGRRYLMSSRPTVIPMLPTRRPIG